VLQRRQAARRPAGRDRARPRRARGTAPAPSSASRVAHRQAQPRGARGHPARVRGARARAARLAAAVGGEVEETVARVGGGALPLTELPSFACAVEESLAQPLRLGEPPIVGIVRDGRLLLDCRTVREDELDEIASAVRARRA
jgi:L-seryl-tRNA(Ser) seleniumtransferase